MTTVRVESRMSETVVLIPVACERCGETFDLECSHSVGFGYMQSGFFRCTSCGWVNRLAAVPGEPARLKPRQLGGTA
jgi:hypothetical protein